MYHYWYTHFVLSALSKLFKILGLSWKYEVFILFPDLVEKLLRKISDSSIRIIKLKTQTKKSSLLEDKHLNGQIISLDFYEIQGQHGKKGK